MSSLILPNGKIENIKMLIFDKDGTLIDVHHYWCSMIEFRAKFFIKSLENLNIDKDSLYKDLIENMGIDLNTKKIKPEGPVGIKSRAFIIDVAYATISKYTNNYTKNKVTDIFAEVDEYSKTKLQDIVKPLEGIIEFLKSLKENGISCSIATTDLSTRAVIAMENLDLKDYFTDIVGADLVENVKPSPDLVNYILQKHNLQPSDVLVVGDSMADLNMAKNANCRFLGVKTGLYTNQFIENSKYLLKDLTEVKVVK
jgi:phosphoglycolate phosphatase